MRPALATVATFLALLGCPAVAAAYYGSGEGEDGAELISADYDRLEQGDDSTVFAAVSADGGYVVLQTRARNFFADDDPDPPGQYRAGGLFRYDVATRDLEKIADGDLFAEDTNAFLRRGASNPSVSADGRYVAFATAEPLAAADANDNVDVYVRDMDVAAGQPGDFDLVSVRDGGDLPASYGPPPVATPGSNPGTDLSRGVAISADGSRVVFRTEVASNLPAGGAVNTGPGQIFVRDRQAGTTTLVTRTDPDGQPAGGGLGASISADGTTVAWTGSNAPAQTRFLAGESDQTSLVHYMWRRLADGPSAPARRITGVSDPDDPACAPGAPLNFDQTTQGPCFGPITDPEGIPTSIIAQVPVLGEDGYTVAYLTGSGPRPITVTGSALDLFVTDMSPGVSRKAGTTELTRGTSSSDPATAAGISGLAMSSDGRHLVITTVRTAFTLPALAPTGFSRSVPGTRELYAIDLEAGTIDRVARSYFGDDISGDVQTGATISNGGQYVAFTSFAGNLFFGDANQRPDAFLATLQEPPDTTPPGPTGPASPSTIDEDRLTVRVRSLGKGEAVVRVEVPEAGGLKVVASGRVGKPRGRRAVATGNGRSTGPGLIEVPLRIVERYRGELRERERIRGVARLDFVASVGGERIADSVGVVFKQKRGKGGSGKK